MTIYHFNMLVKAEDLHVGDEFISPSNGSLRCYKVVRQPQRMKKHPTRWSQVRCTTKVIVVTRTGWNGKLSNKTTYEFAPSEEHNKEVYVNINYKDMWLIKRNGQRV